MGSAFTLSKFSATTLMVYRTVPTVTYVVPTFLPVKVTVVDAGVGSLLLV